MHHVKVCRHPDPWCWPLPRLPAAVWPHHSTPYCTPHAMQSSLNMRVNKSGKRVPCKKKKIFAALCWAKSCVLTCKVFYIHISSLADELLDAAYLSTNRCSVQPSLPSFIAFIDFVFGFRCRVWCPLLTQTGLRLMLWCCICWQGWDVSWLHNSS